LSLCLTGSFLLPAGGMAAAGMAGCGSELAAATTCSGCPRCASAGACCAAASAHGDAESCCHRSATPPRSAGFSSPEAPTPTAMCMCHRPTEPLAPSGNSRILEEQVRASSATCTCQEPETADGAHLL